MNLTATPTAAVPAATAAVSVPPVRSPVPQMQHVYKTNSSVNSSAMRSRMAEALRLQQDETRQVVPSSDASLDAVMSQAVCLYLHKVFVALSAAAHYRTSMSYEGAVKRFGSSKLSMTSDPNEQFQRFRKHDEAINPPRPSASSTSNDDLEHSLPAQDNDMISFMLGGRQSSTELQKEQTPTAGARPRGGVLIEPEDFFSQREVIGNAVLDLYRHRSLSFFNLT